MSLVRLDDVTKTFRRGGVAVHAVNGVTLEIEAGETVALIGESGSGKSTIARLALRLHEPDSGTIEFDGKDLSHHPKKQLRALRSQMAMVFQEPFESLNPRQRIGTTVAEPLLIHERDLSSEQRRTRVREALEQVALPDAYYDRFPHELSGGQQQRVGIARAIVTRPKFIVLDEPTSSLDLSVRAQILQLLARLRAELGLSYLFVSHDIHTVEYVANRIYVMYLGQVVETGTVVDVFRDPQHPYTQALLSATLSSDPRVKRDRVMLGGEIPSASRLPSGCFLHGRCPIGTDECAAARVPLHTFAPGHRVACIKVPAQTENEQAQPPTADANAHHRDIQVIAQTTAKSGPPLSTLSDPGEDG
jgi:oligopeptide/dipeptide ABC transporter ATP-binding protein